MSAQKRNARIAAVVAAALVVVSLTMRWWPDDFSDPTFGEYRPRFLDEWSDDGSHPWHNYLFWSWFAFGYVVQVIAVFAAAAMVGRRGRRADAVVGFAVLCCGWQLVGVRGATLINTTIAPYLGPMAGVVLLGAWILGRSAAASDATTSSPVSPPPPSNGIGTSVSRRAPNLAVVALVLVVASLVLPWRPSGNGPHTYVDLVRVTVQYLDFLPQTTWRDRIDWSWVLVGAVVQLGGVAAAVVLTRRGRPAHRALAVGLAGCVWHGLAMWASLRQLLDLYPVVPYLGVLAALPLAAALVEERRSAAQLTQNSLPSGSAIVTHDIGP